MSEDPLVEMLQFLKPESRLDLKHTTLEHLLGLTGTEEGVNTLLGNKDILQAILDLSGDKHEYLAKIALLILINISAYSEGTRILFEQRPSNYNNLIELLMSCILNPQKKDADAACMVLTNVTRMEEDFEVCANASGQFLLQTLNAFVYTDFNKKGSNLHYLGTYLNNITCSDLTRMELLKEKYKAPLTKLVTFCNYEKSVIRRGGAIGVIRNLTFDLRFHDFLLSKETDLLTYILYPIMGNEDYDDEEMDKLPISLQYLPKEKQRETDVDLRIMIVEILNRLCAKEDGRETLRENGVYYVLREYFKWEKDPKAKLAALNVIDILIQNEDEVGAEDLSSVQVPEDLEEAFRQIDEEFMKTAIDKN